MKCPTCSSFSMIKEYEDKNWWKCINCGQTWRPAILSYDQVKNYMDGLASNIKQLETDYFATYDKRMWMIKKGLI